MYLLERRKKKYNEKNLIRSPPKGAFILSILGTKEAPRVIQHADASWERTDGYSGRGTASMTACLL